MGGRHAYRGRHVCPAGEKEAQKEIGRNSVHCGGCHGKPHKPPERRPKGVLFGEKKRHTLKTPVIVERNSREIIDVQEAKGSEHDFKIYKDTIGKGISTSIPLDADLGYPGIKDYHANSFIPITRLVVAQVLQKTQISNEIHVFAFFKRLLFKN
jgi:hypothetical protein